MVSKYRSTIHPLRDFLPDGTEIRRVPDMTRTGDRPLYTTRNGVPYSHVFVKDKQSGKWQWIYREQALTALSPGKFSVNANRKQRYYVMPHHGSIYLHIAVCLAWNGPCPEGYECDHLNGIVSDNRAFNLQWVTPEENRKRAKLLRVLRNIGRDPKQMSREELLEIFNKYEFTNH